MVCKTGTLK